MVNEETIRQAMAMQIAQQVLENLSEEERLAFLQNGIAAQLKNWKFSSQMEKEMQEQSAALIAEFLQTADAKAQIQAAINKGFANLIKKLPRAIEKATAAFLFGKDGDSSYQKWPGEITKYLE